MAHDDIEQAIGRLNAPADLVNYDLKEVERINHVRRWACERHGWRPPYAPASGPLDDGQMINYGPEDSGFHEALNACRAVEGWLSAPSEGDPATDYTRNPQAAYLKEHPEIYRQRIRPRLLELRNGFDGYLVVAAIGALWAGGEDPKTDVPRLEEMVLDADFAYSAGGTARSLLAKLKRPAPVFPCDPSVLPAYAGSRRTDSQGSLPPGVAFGLDDPRLRHRGGVLAVSVSCDGKMVASGTADGELVLWDVQTGALTVRYAFAHQGELQLRLSGHAASGWQVGGPGRSTRLSLGRGKAPRPQTHPAR